MIFALASQFHIYLYLLPVIVKSLRIVASFNQHPVECCYQYHPRSIPHTAHSQPVISDIFDVTPGSRKHDQPHRKVAVSYLPCTATRHSWLAGSEWRDKNSNKFTFTNNTTIVIEIMCGTFLVLCNFFLLFGIPRTVNFSCKKCHFILDKID